MRRTPAAARPLGPAGIPSVVTPDGPLFADDLPNRVDRGHVWQVQVNAEKTGVVNTLPGEAFSFLGFDFRRVLNRRQQPSILLTPRQHARLAIKAEIRQIMRESAAQPLPAIIQRPNPVLAGWVHYFRVANSNRAFGEVRDYVEMKVPTLRTRRKRRRKRSIGWKRWSNQYLYGVLGLYWDWKLQPLKSAEAYR
jgi:RNA-directed DNA polymerase